ncbi:hypothetical protein NE237_024180 [Protea cynaroides]|uniref:Arginine decarboxylase n=1 Tax=Protea cynaroides TaxID=273540 RepID=A0A9Q0HFE4_9MAGN|nr:hypothetical protein NE237_024180 [Protea cynaroides]
MFVLTAMQILRVVRNLEQASMLDCLQLLHFHIGSQIPSMSLLADGVSEAAQIYSELVYLDVGMRVIDIGGSLGIDYDGSHSTDSDLSISYGLEEYAALVVQTGRYACVKKFVKHPVICSESGQAIVSHHSVLIFEAVSATVADKQTMLLFSPDIPNSSDSSPRSTARGEWDTIGFAQLDEKFMKENKRIAEFQSFVVETGKRMRLRKR